MAKKNSEKTFADIKAEKEALLEGDRLHAERWDAWRRRQAKRRGELAAKKPAAH